MVAFSSENIMESLPNQILNIMCISDLAAYAILAPDFSITLISPNMGAMLHEERNLDSFLGRPLTALFGEFLGAEEGLTAVLNGREPTYRLENLARKQPDASFIYVTARVTLLDPAKPGGKLALLVENSTEVGYLQQSLTQQRNELKQEIGRRQKAEHALQKLNDELERRVQERTAELAEANERLRLLEAAIVNTSDTVIITDAQPDDPAKSGIVYVNNAFTQVTGYTYKEIVGQSQQVFHGPNTDPRQLEKIRSALLNREAVHVELVNYRKDGSEFWVDMTVAPIMSEQNELTHFVSIERDVTERKQLEMALLQAQKMEAVGLLAGGIAHDFNNVLTVILSYSDLLLRYFSENERVRKYVEPIHTAGKRASDLTHQLLAFSRRQMLRPEEVNLNEIVVEVENMIRRPIGEDIHFTTLLAADLWHIQADPGQLSQVIMNLSVNARDAMPNGGTLTLRTENVTLETKDGRINPELTPGEYVKLTVQDTGKGMDNATLARIFDPFFTTKEAGKGTGLGLSTVYGIIAQSGGGLCAHSELGVGTQFEILLPRAGEVSAPDYAIADTAPRDRASETILLVEDEISVRELVREGLEEQGYRLLVAANGEEALAMYRAHNRAIDLLLTDVVMPGMSGVELAQRMQTLSPALKVLYMTGYTDTVTSKHGLLDESIALLQKPFTIGQLTGKIHKTLHQS